MNKVVKIRKRKQFADSRSTIVYFERDLNKNRVAVGLSPHHYISVAVVTSVVMVTTLPVHVLYLRRAIFLQAVILFRCSCELATTEFG